MPKTLTFEEAVKPRTISFEEAQSDDEPRPGVADQLPAGTVAAPLAAHGISEEDMATPAANADVLAARNEMLRRKHGIGLDLKGGKVPGIFDPAIPLPRVESSRFPIAAAVINQGEKLIESVESPVGLAATIAAAGNPVVARLVAAGFGAKAMTDMPEVAQKALQTVYDEKSTPQQRAEAWLDVNAAISQTALVAAAAKPHTPIVPVSEGTLERLSQEAKQPEQVKPVEPAAIAAGNAKAANAPATAAAVESVAKETPITPKPNARLAENFPIQEPYSDKYAVSLQIAAADASNLSHEMVAQSLPPELQGKLESVRRFSGAVANKDIAVPARVEMTFPDKATAQAVIDHFKNAEQTGEQNAIPKREAETVLQNVPAQSIASEGQVSAKESAEGVRGGVPSPELAGGAQGAEQPSVVRERLIISPRTDGMVTLEDVNRHRIGTFKTVDEAGKAAIDLGYDIAAGSQLKPSWKQNKPSMATEEPATIEQHLATAEQPRITTPEGATQIRVTDNKGRVSVQPVSALKKANPFRGVEIAKVEPGTIDKSGKFKAMAGEVGVKEPTPPEATPYSTAPAGPDSLGITPVPSSFGAVAQMVSAAGDKFKGWMETLARKSAPKTTLADRESGEALARYASSQFAAPYLARDMSERVLGGLPVDSELFGAAITENQLRGLRASFLKQAAQAALAGDQALAAKLQTKASAVKTLVGTKGMFRSEPRLQAFVAKPEVQEAARRLRDEYAKRLDPVYQDAIDKGHLPPKPEVGDLFPNTFMNLFVPREGGMPSRKTISVGGPRLTATFKGKTRFSLQRTGAADKYGVDFHDMVANAYAGMLEIANKNVADKALVDAGLAVIETPGQNIELGGQKAQAFPYKRGSLIGVDEEGEVSFGKSQAKDIYVRGDIAKEYEIASNIYRNQYADTLGKVVSGVFNRINLAGVLEAVYHSKNLMRGLMGAPGKNLASDTLLSALPGRPDLLVKGFQFLDTAFRNNREKLAEIATIGAGRQEMPVTLNPATWVSGFINVFDRTTRVVLADAFDQMAAEGIVEPTETNKREFINRVGQYNSRLQGTWMNFFRKSGVGPYITAGTTFNVQGVKTLLMQPGVKATSVLNAAYLRANMAGKLIGTMATVYLTNYLITGKPEGRPGIPIGNIDTGRNDEKGRPLSIPLLDQLTLAPRGARALGVRGAVEQKRLGLTTQQALDASASDIINTWLHPITGPLPQFAVEAATGKAPARGLPRKFPAVAPGQNQFLSDLKYAAGDVNPVAGALIPGMTPDSKPTMAERSVQAGRKILAVGEPKASPNEQVVSKLPQIADLRQLHLYTETLAAEAKKQPLAKRRAYVLERFNKDELAPKYRATAMRELATKGTFRYQ